MSTWKKLEQDIAQWLYSLAADRIVFRNPNQAIVGFPYDGFRSDGMLTDGNVLIAVEVEVGQMHPDTNVGKYWLLQQNYYPYERIILFHVYTPDFDSYGWRMQLGKFSAEKMQGELPFEYHLMDYRSAIPKDYSIVLEEIRSIITNSILCKFQMRNLMP